MRDGNDWDVGELMMAKIGTLARSGGKDWDDGQWMMAKIGTLANG